MPVSVKYPVPAPYGGKSFQTVMDESAPPGGSLASMNVETYKLHYSDLRATRCVLRAEMHVLMRDSVRVSREQARDNWRILFVRGRLLLLQDAAVEEAANEEDLSAFDKLAARANGLMEVWRTRRTVFQSIHLETHEKMMDRICDLNKLANYEPPLISEDEKNILSREFNHQRTLFLGLPLVPTRTKLAQRQRLREDAMRKTHDYSRASSVEELSKDQFRRLSAVLPFFPIHYHRLSHGEKMQSLADVILYVISGKDDVPPISLIGRKTDEDAMLAQQRAQGISEEGDANLAFSTVLAWPPTARHRRTRHEMIIIKDYYTLRRRLRELHKRLEESNDGCDGDGQMSAVEEMTEEAIAIDEQMCQIEVDHHELVGAPPPPDPESLPAAMSPRASQMTHSRNPSTFSVLPDPVVASRSTSATATIPPRSQSGSRPESPLKSAGLASRPTSAKSSRPISATSRASSGRNRHSRNVSSDGSVVIGPGMVNLVPEFMRGPGESDIIRHSCDDEDDGDQTSSAHVRAEIAARREAELEAKRADVASKRKEVERRKQERAETAKMNMLMEAEKKRQSAERLRMERALREEQRRRSVERIRRSSDEPPAIVGKKMTTLADTLVSEATTVKSAKVVLVADSETEDQSYKKTGYESPDMSFGHGSSSEDDGKDWSDFVEKEVTVRKEGRGLEDVQEMESSIPVTHDESEETNPKDENVPPLERSDTQSSISGRDRFKKAGRLVLNFSKWGLNTDPRDLFTEAENEPETPRDEDNVYRLFSTTSVEPIRALRRNSMEKLREKRMERLKLQGSSGRLDIAAKPKDMDAPFPVSQQSSYVSNASTEEGSESSERLARIAAGKFKFLKLNADELAHAKKLKEETLAKQKQECEAASALKGQSKYSSRDMSTDSGIADNKHRDRYSSSRSLDFSDPSSNVVVKERSKYSGMSDESDPPNSTMPRKASMRVQRLSGEDLGRKTRRDSDDNADLGLPGKYRRNSSKKSSSPKPSPKSSPKSSPKALRRKLSASSDRSVEATTEETPQLPGVSFSSPKAESSDTTNSNKYYTGLSVLSQAMKEPTIEEAGENGTPRTPEPGGGPEALVTEHQGNADATLDDVTGVEEQQHMSESSPPPGSHNAEVDSAAVIEDQNMPSNAVDNEQAQSSDETIAAEAILSSSPAEDSGPQEAELNDEQFFAGPASPKQGSAEEPVAVTDRDNRAVADIAERVGELDREKTPSPAPLPIPGPVDTEALTEQINVPPPVNLTEDAREYMEQAERQIREYEFVDQEISAINEMETAFKSKRDTASLGHPPSQYVAPSDHPITTLPHRDKHTGRSDSDYQGGSLWVGGDVQENLPQTKKGLLHTKRVPGNRPHVLVPHLPMKKSSRVQVVTKRTTRATQRSLQTLPKNNSVSIPWKPRKSRWEEDEAAAVPKPPNQTPVVRRATTPRAGTVKRAVASTHTSGAQTERGDNSERPRSASRKAAFAHRRAESAMDVVTRVLSPGGPASAFERPQTVSENRPSEPVTKWPKKPEKPLINTANVPSIRRSHGANFMMVGSTPSPWGY